MSLPIRYSEKAGNHIRELDAWWRENRDKAPRLFREELQRTVELLADNPQLGRPYKHRIKNVRIQRIRKTPYGIYYVERKAWARRAGTILVHQHEAAGPGCPLFRKTSPSRLLHRPLAGPLAAAARAAPGSWCGTGSLPYSPRTCAESSAGVQSRAPPKRGWAGGQRGGPPSSHRRSASTTVPAEFPTERVGAEILAKLGSPPSPSRSLKPVRKSAVESTQRPPLAAASADKSEKSRRRSPAK